MQAIPPTGKWVATSFPQSELMAILRESAAEFDDDASVTQHPDRDLVHLASDFATRFTAMQAISQRMNRAPNNPATQGPLEEQLGAAGDSFYDVMRAIIVTPAMTARGIKLKAAALKVALDQAVFVSSDPSENGDPHEILAWSLVQDILREADAGPVCNPSPDDDLIRACTRFCDLQRQINELVERLAGDAWKEPAKLLHTAQDPLLEQIVALRATTIAAHCARARAFWEYLDPFWETDEGTIAERLAAALARDLRQPAP